jgi:predicted GIY-YIG superfamily endonuclease
MKKKKRRPRSLNGYRRACINVVYLIHSDKRIGTEKQSAQHYLGYCVDVRERFKSHQKGDQFSPKIIQAFIREGCVLTIVRTWKCKSKKDARALERKMKGKAIGGMGQARRCPICQGKVKIK